MFQTYGLSHIQISARDLNRSVQFYRELLGMQELRRFDHCVMMQTPGTREIITINAQPESAGQAGKMGGIAHFGFRLREPVETGKILEEFVRLGGKSIDQGGSRKGGRLYAFGADPDGYEVEIFWEED